MISRKTGIKSVQRGVITIAQGQTTATATISSVVTNNATIDFLGNTSGRNQRGTYDFCSLELTNATTVTAKRGEPDGTYAIDVTYQVTEYH